ncbi:MAG TPA: efflux RND transporter periplasmic adaptor subunit [Phycisphaerae bacterium]|nr:efflux RND transporter periplasmic adaptor subunit [Phycisphaerae bacterium]HOJ75165.1 efflux RND transporter periplasmic adaptor subunit [Phycisphaerae bacterium]HOM52484.1 efflux RND transporter periplasmic adaptor subunit [Phycisphaerae bacterium]HON66396.1 efflux RND transporter periplasmic adaptor subunit [Phycisphaerae bacterium]HPP27758.1 efflux RND transporter periplasmic adaptor subunit [Phycisphaerae bacterium]
MTSPPLTTDRPGHEPSHAPARSAENTTATQAAVHDAAYGRDGEAIVRETVPTDLPRIGVGAVLLLVAALLCLLGGLFVLGYLPAKARHERAHATAAALTGSAPVVSVVRPEPPADSTELVLPANVEAFQQTAIYPRASGYLHRLAVDIGDTVEANQLLAELETPETDAQLGRARAAAQQAEASLAKAEVDLALAESTFRRYDEVAQAGGVARQELDEKRTQVDQARAGVNVARANLEAARAEIQHLEALKSFARITAPFAGVITARNYDVGALLSPSSARPLFQMEQIDTLRVFVNVPQTSATAIEPGQKAELRVSNYPGRAFQGKLVRSAGSIDPTTRTLRVEIHVPNTDRLLYAGMYGQVRLTLTKNRHAWLVPASALIYNADGLSVAIVENDAVHFREVTAGRDHGTRIEILEGLTGTEQVITNPGEHLLEGLPVEVVAAKDVEKPKK